MGTRIVVYGSLINESSLKRTLPEYSGRKTPIIVNGFQRRFNRISVARLKTPEQRASLWPNVGTLDVIRKDGACINAVLLYVSSSQMKSLKEREVGYHLESVDVMDFNTRKFLCRAEIFVSNPMQVLVGDRICDINSDEIMPIPSYMEECFEGAREIGEDFLKVWKQTTFNANGESIDWNIARRD